MSIVGRGLGLPERGAIVAFGLGRVVIVPTTPVDYGTIDLEVGLNGSAGVGIDEVLELASAVGLEVLLTTTTGAPSVFVNTGTGASMSVDARTTAHLASELASPELISLLEAAGVSVALSPGSELDVASEADCAPTLTVAAEGSTTITME